MPQYETFLNAYATAGEAFLAACRRAIQYGRDFDVRRDGKDFFAVPTPRREGDDHAALAYTQTCGSFVRTITQAEARGSDPAKRPLKEWP